MSRQGTSWFPGSATPGSSWKGNNGAEGTAVAAAAPGPARPPGLPALPSSLPPLGLSGGNLISSSPTASSRSLAASPRFPLGQGLRLGPGELDAAIPGPGGGGRSWGCALSARGGQASELQVGPSL